MTTEWFDVTPDPQRITESLRDTGYILNTAVADIVDNSIAADATSVSIELGMDIRGNVRFSAVDDGIGMSPSGLVNAVRYGSERRDDPSSLGKFGLGLKTATTSFARRLKLTSRDEDSESPSTAVWDLDLVGKHGWQVQVMGVADPVDSHLLSRHAGEGTGTVVRWESIDRVIREYRDPTGDRAKNAIKKQAASLGAHLSMVFQRFLDPDDDRAPNVTIRLNGEPLTAWNPFGFGSTQLLDKTLKIETPDGLTKMQLRVVVLPRKAELQAALGEDGHTRAQLINKMQGIYIYRENRLIHGPDWLGLWIQEPHFTLCRAEISFDHTLDEAFQVDIKKSTIVLDTALTPVIMDALTAPRREAELRYRDGQRSAAKAMADPTLHNASNATIQDKSKSIPKAELNSVDKEHGTAEIRNQHGIVNVDFIDSADPQVFVEAVEDLPDGLLYQPTYISANPGVRINKAHPYYSKIYLPNRTSGTTIQALDSLLWALASAEFRSTQESTKEIFEDIRYDVSRALRKLVEDLPEPSED